MRGSPALNVAVSISGPLTLSDEFHSIHMVEFHGTGGVAFRSSRRRYASECAERATVDQWVGSGGIHVQSLHGEVVG